MYKEKQKLLFHLNFCINAQQLLYTTTKLHLLQFLNQYTCIYFVYVSQWFGLRV